MKSDLIVSIQTEMKPILDQNQFLELTRVLKRTFEDVEFIENKKFTKNDSQELLESFLSAKQIEGCSDKTIKYYRTTLSRMLDEIDKTVDMITTDDLRKYLVDYKLKTNTSKTTLDNVRRILSTFFSWLEEEDYILKNPVRRIHKVKQGRVVKETLSDENLETLRDNCTNIRDLAIIELLISTGMRVGELVGLDISDVNFNERECVVFGKGESERVVYFDAKTKLHLVEYLNSRSDDNPALFVSFRKPYKRLGISGVEKRLRQLGYKSSVHRVHPHKFRRTLATNAIDRGMPIEQVQRLLGHVQIDTTMQYAMVNQNNVTISHKKFIS